MRSFCILALGLLLPLASCSRSNDRSAGDNPPVHAKQAKTTNQQPVAADNTGKNVRDRNGDTQTSFDQSASGPDLELTQQIRRAIEADHGLSMLAHNVKIVTVDGVVTLRGPVQSETEKTQVGAKAQQVAGVKAVHNELEIARD